jgi:hypothetical protein
MRWVGHIGGLINADKSLNRKCEEKKLLGIPTGRWEVNIKMDVKEMCLDVDWMYVAQDRNQSRDLMNTIMKFWILLKARNFLTRFKDM